MGRTKTTLEWEELAGSRERMLMIPSPHGTQMTDPWVTVTWERRTRVAGGDASHLPLVARWTRVQRASHRGTNVLALHQLVRHRLGVLHCDPSQLGLDPKHGRRGVLHQNSLQLALSLEVRQLVELHREQYQQLPLHLGELQLGELQLAAIHRKQHQQLLLNLDELAGEL